jgi:hypothetical protein
MGKSLDLTQRAAGRGVLLAVAGALLSFGGALTYFTVFARFPFLRDVPWLNLPLVVAGVVLAATGATLTYRPGRRLLPRAAASFALACSVLFAGGLFAYVFWLSYQVPEASRTAEELRIAPDVTLTRADGTSVSLGSYRGKKLLVVFYRGFW